MTVYHGYIGVFGKRPVRGQSFRLKIRGGFPYEVNKLLTKPRSEITSKFSRQNT
jgi:hypothetical protein